MQRSRESGLTVIYEKSKWISIQTPAYATVHVLCFQASAPQMSHTHTHAHNLQGVCHSWSSSSFSQVESTTSLIWKCLLCHENTWQHLSIPPFLQLHSGHMLWHWLAQISLALPARKRCWINHAVQSFGALHGLIAWFKFIIPYSVFLNCADCLPIHLFQVCLLLSAISASLHQSFSEVWSSGENFTSVPSLSTRFFQSILAWSTLSIPSVQACSKCSNINNGSGRIAKTVMHCPKPKSQSHM